MRVLQKYNSIVQHCNKIIILFRFCSRKKEIYNRVTLSLHIFFSPKKILIKVWFHCTTEVWNFAFLFSIFWRKKCTIKMQNFVKWNHDFIVQQILLQNRITISICIRLLLHNSKWNHDNNSKWNHDSIWSPKWGENGKVIAGWGGKKVF